MARLARLRAPHAGGGAAPGPHDQSAGRLEQPMPSPCRVVVVDDVESVREVVSVVLESEGDFVVVGESGDGDGAVEQVSWHRPDAVVLDLTMPLADGLAALPRLREVGGPDLRICVFSGQDEASTVELARGRGADTVLTKGSAVIELPQRLRSLWA